MENTLIENRYRIRKQLGKGGMGTVYLADDEFLERKVAVKLLSADGATSEWRERLLHEARAIARLNHPHIVTVFDAGEMPIPGQTTIMPYIIMEYVNGQSLHEIDRPSLDLTLALARQICEALHHAHQSGVIHRDIKPENILVSSDMNAKLMDFGIARSLTSRFSFEGNFVGTVHYIAPEQALGEPVDARADLYAFGVLLYELTTGQLPFTSNDPFSVITQHLHAPVVPPRGRNPDIPPALNDLILRMLAKDPADRPDSAASVMTTLDTLTQPAVGSAAPSQDVESREISVLDRIARGRMVGRDRELEELRSAWRKAQRNEGQFMLVSGEPGIGKSRIVRELVTQVEVSGQQALVGECYSEGGAPYHPFAQILGRLLNYLPASKALPEFVMSDILMVAPTLRFVFPQVTPSPAVQSQSEQYRVMENVLSLCKLAAATKPLLIVIEDAHWADSGSLALLRHLVRSVRGEAVMVIATYRESDLDQNLPFQNTLVDFTRSRLGQRVKLGRLTEPSTRSMINALFGESASSTFVSAIFKETEGNPFFIEEVVKSLVEEGRIVFENGHWVDSSPDPLMIPQGIRIVIQQRISKLDNTAQEILTAAGVIGREFDFDTLAATVDFDEESLITACEALDHAQLIEEVSLAHGGTFRFVHALIPSTIVENISGLRRRRLHRRVAEAIFSTDPDDYERLAYHTYESGDLLKSLEYARKAGARAQSVYSMDEAQIHFQRALEISESRKDEEMTATLLKTLGDIYDHCGMALHAVEMFEHALEISAEPSDQSYLMIRIGGSYAAIGDPRGLPFLERAHELVNEESQPRLLALLLTTTARYYHFQSRHEIAAEYLEKARVIAEANQYHDVLSNLYTYLAGTYQHLMMEPVSRHWAKKAIELGEKTGDLLPLAAGYEFLAENAIVMGNYREGLHYAQLDYDFGKKAGALDRLAWAEFCLCNANFGLGNLQKARELGESAMDLAERINDHRLKIWISTVLAPVTFLLGDSMTAARLAENGLNQARDLNQSILICSSIGSRSMILNFEEEWETALALHQEAKTAYQSGDNESAFFFSLDSVRTLLHLDLLKEARQILDEARVRAQKINHEQAILQVDFLDALYHLAMKDFNQAETTLKHILEGAQKSGARLREGETLFHLGRCYAGRADSENARKAFDSAVSVFTGCGAIAWVKLIEGEILKLS